MSFHDRPLCPVVVYRLIDADLVASPHLALTALTGQQSSPAILSLPRCTVSSNQAKLENFHSPKGPEADKEQSWSFASLDVARCRTVTQPRSELLQHESQRLVLQALLFCSICPLLWRRFDQGSERTCDAHVDATGSDLRNVQVERLSLGYRASPLVFPASWARYLISRCNALCNVSACNAYLPACLQLEHVCTRIGTDTTAFILHIVLYISRQVDCARRADAAPLPDTRSLTKSTHNALQRRNCDRHGHA